MAHEAHFESKDLRFGSHEGHVENSPTHGSGLGQSKSFATACTEPWPLGNSTELLVARKNLLFPLRLSPHPRYANSESCILVWYHWPPCFCKQKWENAKATLIRASPRDRQHVKGMLGVLGTLEKDPARWNSVPGCAANPKPPNLGRNKLTS